jgi:hypothetical protein
LCKDCGRTFRDGDEREKYTIEQKIRVIKLYTDGVGMRSIERAEGVSTPLLIHWIRNFGKMLREKISTTPIPNDAKDIEIFDYATGQYRDVQVESVRGSGSNTEVEVFDYSTGEFRTLDME